MVEARVIAKRTLWVGRGVSEKDRFRKWQQMDDLMAGRRFLDGKGIGVVDANGSMKELNGIRQFGYARHYRIEANLGADGRTSIMGRADSGLERSSESLGCRRGVSLDQDQARAVEVVKVDHVPAKTARIAQIGAVVPRSRRGCEPEHEEQRVEEDLAQYEPG